jgi:hypothetical protein
MALAEAKAMAEALCMSHEGHIAALEAKLAVAREALEAIVTVTEETQTVHMQHCACNYRCLDLAREALARMEKRP